MNMEESAQTTKSIGLDTSPNTFSKHKILTSDAGGSTHVRKSRRTKQTDFKTIPTDEDKVEHIKEILST